jgi:hypothetical protein
MHTNIRIFLLEKLGKRPLGRPRHRWDLWEIECEGMDWMHLAQDRDQRQALLSTVINLWVS